MSVVATFTAQDYRVAFEYEQKREYPIVDALEARCGYSIDRHRLEDAARILACPVKKNGANWQHGRVLYAVARQWLERQPSGFWNLLDIGTAKGFSALCLQWAIDDSGRHGQVVSVDVIDPMAAVSRNTIAEVDGPLTLHQIHRPWPATSRILFLKSTGIDHLTGHDGRIHIAFVDGKHSGHVVLKEGRLLTARQTAGDVAFFDDVHIPDVSQAVNALHFDYRLEYLEVLPHRHYAIGVRK